MRLLWCLVQGNHELMKEINKHKSNNFLTAKPPTKSQSNSHFWIVTVAATICCGNLPRHQQDKRGRGGIWGAWDGNIMSCLLSRSIHSFSAKQGCDCSSNHLLRKLTIQPLSTLVFAGVGKELSMLYKGYSSRGTALKATCWWAKTDQARCYCNLLKVDIHHLCRGPTTSTSDQFTVLCDVQHVGGTSWAEACKIIATGSMRRTWSHTHSS